MELNPWSSFVLSYQMQVAFYSHGHHSTWFSLCIRDRI